MKAKVLIDAKSNLFLFDGKYLRKVKKTQTLREIIKNTLYVFDDDLYLKTDDGYELLIADIEIFPFEASTPQAIKQFRLINGLPLFINPLTLEITRLDNAEFYPKVFFTSPKNKELPDFVIIEKASGKILFGQYRDNNFTLTPVEAVCGDCVIFWNGRIYELDNGTFAQKPIVIYKCNNKHLLFHSIGSKKASFRLSALGEIEYLGNNFCISQTKVSKILWTSSHGFKTLWHIQKDDIKKIMSANETDAITIDTDTGLIRHTYKTNVGFDYGGVIDASMCYTLKNGSYTNTYN